MKNDSTKNENINLSSIILDCFVVGSVLPRKSHTDRILCLYLEVERGVEIVLPGIEVQGLVLRG